MYSDRAITAIASQGLTSPVGAQKTVQASKVLVELNEHAHLSTNALAGNQLLPQSNTQTERVGEQTL
jgi:hypothetical protein